MNDEQKGRKENQKKNDDNYEALCGSSFEKVRLANSVKFS